MYGLVLLTEIVWAAIVPVAPAYAHAFGLSSVETGAVLASAGVSTLLVSLPVGLLSDRFGARTLVLAAAALVTISTLGQGLAGDFWELLLARAGFGVALGIVWTAGIAWLAEGASAGGRPESLGLPMTVAGVGIVAGPGLAGLVADATNVHVPFYLLAAASLPVTLALLRTPRDAGTRVAREPLARTIAKTRADRALLGSLIVMTLVGIAGGGVNLLVPLQLKADGLTAGTIGLALSGSALVFVVTSAVLSRRPGAADLRLVGLAALAYALTMLLVVVDGSPAGVISFVLVRAPFWGALSTLAYPLAALGARRAHAGIGAVNGLLNLAWGGAGSASPVAAGALAAAIGTGGVFLGLAGVCAAAGCWLLAAGTAGRAPVGPASPEPG